MATLGTIKLSSILDHTLARLTTSATVGVDKTFSPEGFTTPGVARWVDRSGGIPVGYPVFTLSVRRPVKANRNYKVSMRIFLPTLEQTSPSTSTGIQPAPIKAYDCAFIGDFILPERSTQAERAALFSVVASAFTRLINANDGVPTDATGSPLETAVTTFEPPFG